VIHKIETYNTGIYLQLENIGKNGFFELIDMELVFESESTNKIKINHIKTMLYRYLIGIDKP
jgi:hypothetical protein